MGKVQTVTVFDIYNNSAMMNIEFVPVASVAGAASFYGSGSTKMMRLRPRLRNTRNSRVFNLRLVNYKR
jgi:hypothetical protein